MFLAVNQSLQNTQRRREETAAKATVSRASQETTDSTTQLVANMLDASQGDSATSRSSSLGAKCDSCQHMQQPPAPPLPTTSCKCDCNCINKAAAGENVRTSLVLVYLYLGALTLMLATLAILFYTYTQSTLEESPSSPLGLSQSAFHVQFRGELMRSEHVLRAMVTQILERDYPLMETM